MCSSNQEQPENVESVYGVWLKEHGYEVWHWFPEEGKRAACGRLPIENTPLESKVGNMDKEGENAKLRALCEHWWPLVNRRRGDLIHRDVAGTITTDEAAELAKLQDQADTWIDIVAPLDLTELERLHAEVVPRIGLSAESELREEYDRKIIERQKMSDHHDGVNRCERCLQWMVERLAALEAIVNPLSSLREPEGASVTFFCDNPEFDDNPDCVIEVCDDWTDWKYRRFGGTSLTDALRQAEKARGK